VRQAFTIPPVINGKGVGLNRAEISEKVIQLFVDTIGFIDRSQVTEQTDFIHDFKIIDDDLTCFIMQIKWQFNLRATQEDWDCITTIKQIVDLIVQRSPPQRSHCALQPP
jgi:acyl carrier protein